MNEPKKYPLTDSPRTKNVPLTPLPSQGYYDIELDNDLWIKNNEDHQQNNSESIQQLESDSTD